MNRIYISVDCYKSHNVSYDLVILYYHICMTYHNYDRMILIRSVIMSTSERATFTLEPENHAFFRK